MQLTSPHVGWTDINATFSTLDIADYHVNLYTTQNGAFSWQIYRSRKLICTGTADDQGDARDVVEDTIRDDFDARHQGA
jgi:TATA-box binding protein (TBP) (component of TFIID and TFIIIB)